MNREYVVQCIKQDKRSRQLSKGTKDLYSGFLACQNRDSSIFWMINQNGSTTKAVKCVTYHNQTQNSRPACFHAGPLALDTLFPAD
ncbi:hypothetical protein BH24CHL1_BH24CHL1_07940 [soil metagenome]